MKPKNQFVIVEYNDPEYFCFQQILECRMTGTEALLRGFIQQVPWMRFLFVVSRHHLTGEMFLSAKHPFYQSTDILSLKVIDRSADAAFARGHFVADGQHFELNASAQSVLEAIAAEGEVNGVYSGGFLRRHALKSTSTVRSTPQALVSADLVYRTETGYVVYDRLFGEWLRRARSET